MSKARLSTVVLLGAASLSCEPVPLTAPPGSNMFLQANPSFVIANGGRSLITALITEPSGTLVPDGVEVFFFTTLGHVDETATTRDGVARVYFVADARSGTALVTAMSGGPAAQPPTTTPPTTTTAAAKLTATSANVTAENSASVEITIGSALPHRLVLGADPARITSPRWARLIANVFDEFGNPVQNVPVIFQITQTTGGGAGPGGGTQETLDSGGAPRFTDSNGQAFDTLRTTVASGGAQREVRIRATTSNGVTSATDLSVFID